MRRLLILAGILLGLPASAAVQTGSIRVEQGFSVRNLETHSQDNWGTQMGADGTLAISASSIPAPDGTSTAQQIAGSTTGANIYGVFSVIAAPAAAVSVFVATASGTQSVSLQLYDSTTSSVISTATATARSSWTRISTSSAIVSGHTIAFLFYPGGVSGTGTIQGWGFQLEASSYAGPYCPTTTAAATCSSSPPIIIP